MTGTSGLTRIFLLDPIVSSGDPELQPQSTNIDRYLYPIELTSLTGHGVLKGKYVDVSDGLFCDGRFGAYDIKQNFVYPYGDPRFQEVMAYYYGNYYKSFVDSTGYSQNHSSTNIVAHCELADNAFYVRSLPTFGQSMNTVEEMVCLGDSVKTPGAFYPDDGTVVMHELQHGATVANYSLTYDLSQLRFDEGGALSEAISDFVSLMLAETLVPDQNPLDPRIFSRWALGTFDPHEKHFRGAHKCPTYDSAYPDCTDYPLFRAGSNPSSKTSISYIYPDGLGWPYPSNFSGNSILFEIYGRFQQQEEIHNSGTIILGALWDAYEAVKKNHSSQELPSIRIAITQLIHEAIRHLPFPNSRTNRSPITFIEFAKQLAIYSNRINGLTDDDVQDIRQALENRGLYRYPHVPSRWMGNGPGANFKIPETPTPGVFIMDNPVVLKQWLENMGKDPTLISQSGPTSLNSKLDPGEIAVIWFDIQNNSEQTVGGVLVSAASFDDDLTFFNNSLNPGFLSDSLFNEAQVMYSKINGKQIVRTLGAVSQPFDTNQYSILPLGNTYFKTNPFFNHNFRTGLWVRVSPSAPHGKTIQIRVQATPSNGMSENRKFKVVIN